MFDALLIERACSITRFYFEGTNTEIENVQSTRFVACVMRVAQTERRLRLAQAARGLVGWLVGWLVGRLVD